MQILSKKIFLFVLFIFSLFGAYYFTSVGIERYAEDAAYRGGSEVTRAVIVDRKYVWLKKSSSLQATVIYKFTTKKSPMIKGETTFFYADKGARKNPGLAAKDFVREYPLGKEVEVLYVTNDPNQNRLARYKAYSFWQLILCIVTSIGVPLILAFLLFRKEESKDFQGH